ncbi:response regulator [Rossellomorea vietnamensis]|uniref:Response regulator n=1 Tax=Rossellomorea vietnamensis TaxID=218284 RepID=A0A5D4KAS6_9BACI|nr:response regulator [Rossellomorea vietnamensis]TYR74408.1 response regulator [Rossellomorea vietnamensis]
MIKVLIIEDDPMVAEFNKRYLDKVDGFALVDVVHTTKEAKSVLELEKVDLMLLDVFMPGGNGLELLREVRERGLAVDAILITAASDTEKIQSALRFGAIDYLIKPFEFDRFKQALLRFKEKQTIFHNSEKLSQDEIDQRLFEPEKSEMETDKSLPKGLTKNTLQVIVETIKELKNFSTDELAEHTNISRVSVRKYLVFLTELKVLEETLVYGIGRPVYQYSYKENDKVLEGYL